MPRSSNYTRTQSYRYMLTPFTPFVHTPSHGGCHHPFPGCGGSPGRMALLQEMQLPQLCLPRCCSQKPTDTPAIKEAPQKVSLHREVGSLHAAPALPTHGWVPAAPGVPWGGCTAQPGQGSGCPEDTANRDRPLLAATAAFPLSLPMSHMSILPLYFFSG